MVTLLLEVDDEILARAQTQAHHSGGDVRQQLSVTVKPLQVDSETEQTAAFHRMVARADAIPGVLVGGLMSRDERNER